MHPETLHEKLITLLISDLRPHRTPALVVKSGQRKTLTEMVSGLSGFVPGCRLQPHLR